MLWDGRVATLHPTLLQAILTLSWHWVITYEVDVAMPVGVTRAGLPLISY